MNNQEMFNTAYIGIIKQGGPSVEGTSCAYRSQNGRKCAAGWLMTDEEFCTLRTRIPHNNVNTTGLTGLANLPTHFYGNSVFIGGLQHIHDDSFFESEGDDEKFLSLFKQRMVYFAQSYNLTIPEIPSDDLPQTNS